MDGTLLEGLNPIISRDIFGGLVAHLKIAWRELCKG
jgi:hypothetical protein